MKNYKFYISIFAAILVIIYSFTSTLQYKNESVYNDLRTRVTGTRLQEFGKSAYFGKWEKGDPTSLQNPTRTTPILVNGNTVTPTVLLFTKSLHHLQLKTIATIWYYGSYFCLIGIVLLLSLKIYKNKNTSPFVITLVALFAIAGGFKIHLLAGQMYIYYTFLAALSFYLYTESKWAAAAIVAGILTTLRLPMVLLFLPIFLFQFNKKYLITFFSTVVICIFATQFFMYNTIWTDYFSAMQHYALENAKLMPEGTIDTYIVPSYSEGVTNYFATDYANYYNHLQSDIFSIQRLLVILHLPSSANIMYVLYLTFCIGLFLLIKKLNPNFYTSKKLFLIFALVLVLCFDYFIPALRFSYNFVQLSLLISLIVFFNIYINKTAMLLFVIGIVLNIFKLTFIPDCYSVGEVFCMFATVNVLINTKVAVQNEVFQLGWLGRNIITKLGLYPKMGVH